MNPDAILALPGSRVTIHTDGAPSTAGRVDHVLADHHGDPLAVVIDHGAPTTREIIPWHAIATIVIEPPQP